MAKHRQSDRSAAAAILALAGTASAIALIKRRTVNVNGISSSREEAFMRRCIDLSRSAIGEGEYPYGAILALDGKIVSEAINRALRERDSSKHAEVLALAEGQKRLSEKELSRATLYINVEPCAMCSYCIRETGVGRVVFSLSSPVMGGFSKWNILRDAALSRDIPLFGPPPEVLRGLLESEAKQVWLEWDPPAWELAKLRGILAAQPLHDFPAGTPSFVHRVLLFADRLFRSTRSG